MKKVFLSFLLLIGIVAYSQDDILNESRVNLKAWPKNKVNGQMLAEKELVSELYKIQSERTYEEKARTSLIIGLALLPPAVLFAKLAEPEYPDRYKIGWGAAAFAAVGVATFYIIRYTVYKKRAKNSS